MICVSAFEPTFLECLGEELFLVEVMPETVVFPHVPTVVEGFFGVVIVHSLLHTRTKRVQCDFIVGLHSDYFLEVLRRDWLGFGTGLVREWLGLVSQKRR